MVDPDTPAAARTLLRQLGGWSTRTNPATGPCEFGGLSEETDGNGRRRRVNVVEIVDSLLVQARHVDGRALVALWIRRPGTTPAGKRKGWSLELAWRGRDLADDRDLPQRITARQLTAYATAPDLHIALRAVTDLAPKAAKEKGAAA